MALENKNVKCFKMSTKDTRSNLPWTSVGTLLQCGGGTFSHRPTSSSIIGIFLNLVVTTYKSEMMKVWFETNAGAQQFIQWKKNATLSHMFRIWRVQSDWSRKNYIRRLIKQVLYIIYSSEFTASGILALNSKRTRILDDWTRPHSLIREVLIQSCSAGAKKFTNSVVLYKILKIFVP